MNHVIFFLSCPFLFGGCCTEDFIVPEEETGPVNDDRANALDITSLFDLTNCPNSNASYTTSESTPDGGPGSCWLTQTNAGDVWFRFASQSQIGYASFFLNVGGTEGTQRSSQMVLWDIDGTTEIGCRGYDLPDDDLYLFNGNLVQGQVYYLSVSVPDNADKGTFSLCVNTSD